MTTGSRYVDPFAHAFTSTNAPVPDATLTFYLTGSSTLTPTYSDAALMTPNANPVTADANGLFPNIFLDPAVTYKAVLQYPANGIIPGAVIYTADPAETVPQSSASVPPILETNAGAGYIGTETGQTVEFRLEAIDTEITNLTAAVATKAPNTEIGSLIGLLTITATGALVVGNIGYLVELTNASAQTLTLAAAGTLAAGDSNKIVNIGAGAWTITAPSGGFIGAGVTGTPSTYVLTSGSGITITFDGTNWFIDGAPHQSWVNVTGSRADGTTYTNSTNAEIFVSVAIVSNESGADRQGTITAGGVTVAQGFIGGVYSGHVAYTIGFPVPVGNTYKATIGSGGYILNWAERR